MVLILYFLNLLNLINKYVFYDILSKILKKNFKIVNLLIVIVLNVLKFIYRQKKVINGFENYVIRSL